ncbi:hypothetical protein K439DRAFT_1623961 [Ramaria rubella]|nr:hypothetical protein K439DRAFT_1623961 [Ramaria rubella]
MPESTARAEQIALESATYEAISISVANKYATMKKMLKSFALQVYGLPAEAFWSSGQLGMMVLNYLTQKVQHTMPVRHCNAEKVAWGTLKSWQLSLTWVIAKYAHEGRKVLAENGLYARIYQHSTYLLKMFNLECIIQHSTHFGCFEICHMLKYLVTTTQELEVLLQHHVMINLEFTLGVRPGTMGGSYLEWKNKGLYLKLKSHPCTLM